MIQLLTFALLTFQEIWESEWSMSDPMGSASFPLDMSHFAQ